MSPDRSSVPGDSKALFPKWAEEFLIRYFEEASRPENPPLSEKDLFEKFKDLFAHAPRLLQHPAVIRVKKIWTKEGKDDRAKIAKLEHLAGKYGQTTKKKIRGRPRKSPKAFDLMLLDYARLVSVLSPIWKKARSKRNQRAYWSEWLKGRLEHLTEKELTDLASSKSAEECARIVLGRQYGLSHETIERILKEHRAELREAKRTGRFESDFPIQGLD